MKEYLAIVTAEHAYLRAEAENENGENLSGIEDEIFSGWAVKVLETLPGKKYVKIETHYGYSGYVKEEELRPVTETELEERQDKERFFRLGRLFELRILKIFGYGDLSNLIQVLEFFQFLLVEVIHRVVICALLCRRNIHKIPVCRILTDKHRGKKHYH